MKIKQSVNYKELKLSLQQEEPIKLNPNQLRQFANQLKRSATDLVSNLTQYADSNEALLELQNIQMITQKLIASINAGARKTMVTPAQMVQQTRDIAKMKAPKPGEQQVAPPAVQ